MKAAVANKKTKKKKIVLTTLAVGAAGILGYFGWQYYKKGMRSLESALNGKKNLIIRR